MAAKVDCMVSVFRVNRERDQKPANSQAIFRSGLALYKGKPISALCKMRACIGPMFNGLLKLGLAKHYFA